jgi:hypothetical protein
MTELRTGLTVNAVTGEQVIAPLSREELDYFEVLIKQSAEIKAAEQAKADAKASALAKLTELGLTEAEIAAL